MSWLDDLSAELRARGVPGRDRHRIELELSDHIACDPGCEDRLGDPRALAVTFADELATARARSSALTTFGALTLAAIALIVSQLTLTAYPGFSTGVSQLLFMPAVFGMLIAPQVALVAGSLAALRALRRRRARSLPAAEIALMHRRARVALGAGFATVAGLELYVVDFSLRLPGWWLALTGGLAAAAGMALTQAWRTVTRARAIASGNKGRAGDLYDDLPVPGRRWLRRRPWRLGALTALTVGLVMTVFEAHAEHSLLEGIQRGAFEGLAAAGGFALLGRAIGAFPATREELASAGSNAPGRGTEMDDSLGFGPPDRLVADTERVSAEATLRESFAEGRLTVEELDARLAAVYAARTLEQLSVALMGLPPDA